MGLISPEHTTLVSKLVHSHNAELSHYADSLRGTPAWVSNCCLAYKQIALQIGHKPAEDTRETEKKIFAGDTEQNHSQH